MRKEVYTNGVLASTQYYVRDVAGSVMAVYSEQTQLELPIYGASRLGIYHKNGDTNYELTDHLGNVRAVVTKDDPTPSIFADYYPGEDGALIKCPVDIFSERASLPRWKMPNRNVQGNYRYNYQGQELDNETGKVAFQLRLYDPRINRWLTTDPYGQYHSPYVGMGNDWPNGIDSDGGYKTKVGQLWAWAKNGFKGDLFTSDVGTGNYKYGIDLDSGMGSDLVYSQKGFDAATQNWKYFGGNGFVESSVRSFEPNTYGKIQNYLNDYDMNSSFGEIGLKYIGNIAYNVINDGAVTLQTMFGSDRSVRNLNSSGVIFGSYDHLEKGINTFTGILPTPPVNKVVNAAEFSVLHKGTSVLKVSHKVRSMHIRSHNINAREAKSAIVESDLFMKASSIVVEEFREE